MGEQISHFYLFYKRNQNPQVVSPPQSDYQLTTFEIYILPQFASFCEIHTLPKISVELGNEPKKSVKLGKIRHFKEEKHHD